MTDSISLIYPHQLFKQHPALHTGRPVWLIEDDLFFNQYRFHKQKLAFHRIAMQRYEKLLREGGFTTRYITSHERESSTAVLFEQLNALGIKQVHLVDPTDYLLKRRLHRYSERSGTRVQEYPNPNFLCTSDELRTYFESKKKFFLTEFYIDQRKKQRILLDGEQPVGGRWTFDTENRKRMPASVRIPPVPVISASSHSATVLQEISNRFPENPGNTDEFNYPTTHTEAEQWLDAFLKERFGNFGDYQDAMVNGQVFLFHSLVSPLLNTGLLDPMQIVTKALESSADGHVPINALEGFIRQVIGWREYIRAVYELQGVGQRTRNFFGHRRKIPASFYCGTTGIIPVDDAIRKTLRWGYAHHIERLMIVGNFMLLCEFDPDEVYRWFMEMYIDAYDWVMVPNVYGMSQFADGGWMSTKPYISGSNYILKMSDYPKGPWCDIWDGLYWRFIHRHRDMFLKNPRMSMMVRQADKMSPERFSTLMKTADDFLAGMD